MILLLIIIITNPSASGCNVSLPGMINDQRLLVVADLFAVRTPKKIIAIRIYTKMAQTTTAHS